MVIRKEDLLAIKQVESASRGEYQECAFCVRAGDDDEGWMMRRYLAGAPSAKDTTTGAAMVLAIE